MLSVIGAVHYRTRWDDFTERLDWVLRTLPYAAIVINTPDGHHIQFWTTDPAR
ncbi:hypothetical protein [Nocardia sp. NPDC004860]|uniref:hypothetical protein n=1 Tax=Nocardia sp. NPDC004860 TaxID=3154557 RepID=UPI0033BEC5D1